MNEIIDTNVYVGQWPFRRLYGDQPAELLEKLQSAGVAEAWTGSFDGVFQRDLAAVNERLVQTCADAKGVKLVPFGSVNPTLPAWQDDVRRCHETHRMPGIRLHPNYHGYKLDDPVVDELLAMADERGLIVQISMAMEDERTQSHLARVEAVDSAPLAKRLKALPKLRVVLLNSLRAAGVNRAATLADAGQAYFEIATLESMAGVPKLVSGVTLDRVLFGSYFPFFYHESAVLKLQESGLPNEALNAIRYGNARKLITSV